LYFLPFLLLLSHSPQWLKSQLVEEACCFSSPLFFLASPQFAIRYVSKQCGLINVSLAQRPQQQTPKNANERTQERTEEATEASVAFPIVRCDVFR
jgi:hypothetical protein